MKNASVSLFALFLLLPVLRVSAQDLGGLVDEIESRTHFGIFTDFRSEFFDDDGTHSYEGTFVGHVSTQLSPRFKYFAEFTLTPDRGYFGQIRLERSLFQFFYSDLLQLRFGRLHTPVSRWNVLYHHGQYLQTPINRPDILKSSNRLSPIHSTVIEVGGSYGMAAGRVTYAAGIGASDDHIHPPGVGMLLQQNPAWYVSAAFVPERLMDLRIGGTLYREKVLYHPEIDDGRPHNHDLHSIDRDRTINLHMTYDGRKWSLLSELMAVTHWGKERYGGTAGYYAQVERQLPAPYERGIAYVRYDRLVRNMDDPVFSTDPFRVSTGVTSGVRVNIYTRVAITTELRMYGEDLTFPERHLYVQLSAGF